MKRKCRRFPSVEDEKMSEVYETQYAVASTKQGQEQGRAFLYGKPHRRRRSHVSSNW
jgi:hypothetical protein